MSTAKSSISESNMVNTDLFDHAFNSIFMYTFSYMTMKNENLFFGAIVKAVVDEVFGVVVGDTVVIITISVVVAYQQS